MSYIRHEAPGSLVSFIWAVAGLLGIFFAVVISSFFILKHYYPVSADDVTMKAVTGNCDKTKNESRVAIHNYPGEAAIEKAYPKVSNDYQHKVVEEALGGDYQCSNICVTGVDQSKAINDPANVAVIKKFLDGATVGGKPMVFKDSGDQFISMISSAISSKNQASLDELKRVVIATYSKNLCVGYSQGQGQSVDYAQIMVKDTKVKIEEPNKTKEQTDTAQEQQKATEQTTSKSNPVPIAGAPQTGFGVPVTSNNDSTNSGDNPETLVQCKSRINEFLYKYDQLLKGVTQKDPDPDITRYYEIQSGYVGLGKDPYLSDDSKALTRCLEIEKLVDTMSNKLWGNKTVLAQCKKTVNDFLATYKDKTVAVNEADPTDKAETATAYYEQVSSDYWHIKYNPYYKVSAIRQTKMCNHALDYINEYKVLTGVAEGPSLQTPAQTTQIANEKEQKIRDQRSAEVASDNITLRVFGNVYWDKSGKNYITSKRAHVCVATYTKNRKIGSMAHKFYTDGHFDLSYTLSPGDRPAGIAIMFYDDGNIKPARVVLRKWTVDNMTDWIYRSFIEINTASRSLTANLGDIDLSDGVGISEEKSQEFKMLTGNSCP